MADDLRGQLSRAWQGLVKKTTETIAEQEASFVRGQIAGKRVTDDAGNVIVDAGHVIDDAAIVRASAAGKLHALAGAAIKAQAQDAREKIADQLEKTPDGREARSLNSVDQFVEARRYVGQIAGVDVLDMRGDLILSAGQRITEDDVRRAREADQLGALIYSAQQPAPVPAPGPASSEIATEAVAEHPAESASPPPVIPVARPARRSPLPLITPEKDSSAE